MPPAQPPSSMPAPQAVLRGTVRETMNAAGYTYLRLDVAGVDRWVATTETTVPLGMEVVVEGGTMMSNFRSRTLNRTFDQILFASAIRPATAQPPAAAMPPSAAPPPSPMMPSTVSYRGIVRETMNAAGYTYLRVESGGASRWAAVPATTVAVGDEVEVPAGSEMPGFHSGTLNRTFEQITFAGAIHVVHHANGQP